MTAQFQVGQLVVSNGTYMHLLQEGAVYTVVDYEPPLVTPTFTWPAYVTVNADGRRVTGHAHRFTPKES